MTGSTGRLPAISQQTKAVASPLDANPALIANCDNVCVTQGTLERECGKNRPSFKLSEITRNLIDEKQMSEGAAPNENAPMIDEIVRKNGGIKELIGDRKQSRGGRETLVQRIATMHAIFMKVAGTGTHTGYVTCPTFLTQCELLLSRITPLETIMEELDDSTRTIQELAKTVDNFKEALNNYEQKWQCEAKCGNGQVCSACKRVNLDTATLQKLCQGGYSSSHQQIAEESLRIKGIYSAIPPKAPTPKVTNDLDPSPADTSAPTHSTDSTPGPTDGTSVTQAQKTAAPSQAQTHNTTKGIICGSCHTPCTPTEPTPICQYCETKCHLICFEALEGTQGPPRCIACRDTDRYNETANQQLVNDGDQVAWPDKNHAPKTPTNPVELAFRTVTMLKLLPALANSEFRYTVMEAANLCWRYLPDTILPVNLSRRLGPGNTFFYFASNYARSCSTMGLKPYAPSPLSGRIRTGAILTQGMPPIDIRSALEGTANPRNMTYPQDIGALRIPEFYEMFTLNVSQASPTLSTYYERNQYNLKNTMFAFKSWLPFAYAFFGVLFTKLQPCYVITPTKENRDEMCKMLGIQEFGNTFDEHAEDITADQRLEDCMHQAPPEGRETIIAELMNASSGIGAAGHTVAIRTASEVVGVTGNYVVVLYSKSSDLQNSETGNTVNGTRGTGGTNQVIPAFNKQASSPRARRESAILASGHAVIVPPHNHGHGHFPLSRVITFTLQEIVGQDRTILNDTALRSRENIDPVVAHILPNFLTPLHLKMRLNDVNEPNAIAWVMGHTDHTYTPHFTPSRTPISYGTIAVSLSQEIKDTYGHEHDGFYKLTPGTSINGFKCNRLGSGAERLLFNTYWHRIAFFRTNLGLLATNPNPMTALTPGYWTLSLENGPAGGRSANGERSANQHHQQHGCTFSSTERWAT